MLDRLNSLLHGLLRRRRVEQNMEQELRSHIELYSEDLIAEGLSPEEARRRARVEFGTLGAVKDECREAMGLHIFGLLARNLVYTLRLLRRSPVFATSIIATLALCIGANTALFSVVDAVLFRPLPYPQPDRLAQVTMHFENARGEGDQMAQTGGVWEGVRDRPPTWTRPSLLNRQAASTSRWTIELNSCNSNVFRQASSVFLESNRHWEGVSPRRKIARAGRPWPYSVTAHSAGSSTAIRPSRTAELH